MTYQYLSKNMIFLITFHNIYYLGIFFYNNSDSGILSDPVIIICILHINVEQF